MESVPYFLAEILAKAMHEEVCADLNLGDRCWASEYPSLKDRYRRAATRFFREAAASQEFDRYMRSQQDAMRQTIERLQREVEAAQRSDDGWSIKRWQEKVHDLAVSKGWHERSLLDGDPKTQAERVVAQLALIVTEVAEAIECLRDGTHDDVGKAGISKLQEEIADIVIRSMDLASAIGFDLQSAIKAKHKFNERRELRHGGKIL